VSPATDPSIEIDGSAVGGGVVLLELDGRDVAERLVQPVVV
jgi:hypothetical protein